MPELVAGQRGVAQDNSVLQAHVAMVLLARYGCGAPCDRGRLAKMRWPVWRTIPISYLQERVAL
jgi:hypothetical protein